MSDLSASSRGRRILFALLYLAEGAPIGFLWWLLPVELRGAGVDTASIGAFVAAIGLPWTLKFLWAPVIDVARTVRFGFREWAISAQAMMVLTLTPLLAVDLAAASGLVLAILVVHAFAAATQDVAVDALAIATVPSGERGAVNGWMNMGMLTGRALFGALALRASASLPLTAVVAALILTLCLTIGALGGVRGGYPEPAAGDRSARLKEFGRELRGALGQRGTWAGLGFALIAGAGFEVVGIFAGPLLVDRGLGNAAIGDWRLVSVACMIGGGLAGGRLADRIGKAPAVGAATTAMAAAVLFVAGFADAGAIDALLLALDALYVGIGLFTATSYALFMDLTSPRLGATQFTAFMAMTNACEVWASAAGGLGVERIGYGATFALLGGVGLLALPLLLLLRRGREEADDVVR